MLLSQTPDFLSPFNFPAQILGEMIDAQFSAVMIDGVCAASAKANGVRTQPGEETLKG